MKKNCQTFKENVSSLLSATVPTHQTIPTVGLQNFPIFHYLTCLYGYLFGNLRFLSPPKPKYLDSILGVERVTEILGGTLMQLLEKEPNRSSYHKNPYETSKFVLFVSAVCKPIVRGKPIESIK